MSTLGEKTRLFRSNNGKWSDRNVISFARKVAREERERCAKIADTYKGEYEGDIGAAIRRT